jgi:NRPS condensation-like uncharacterized protein
MLIEMNNLEPITSHKIKSPVPDDFWLRLDNAAKIYPAILTDELTAVFRLSAVLKEPLKIKPFLKAVHLLEYRFPYYKVLPKKGFFWYYLEFYDHNTTVIPDVGIPCRRFEKDELLFRILVKGKKVSVEFSHILTDGAGAFEFLKSLLMTYFQECGVAVNTDSAFMKFDEKPSNEEFEDSFSRYFQKHLPSLVKIPKSFHLPFSLKLTPRFKVLSFLVPIDKINALAKQYKVSLTVYLVGVYLYALQNIFNKMTALKKRRSRKILRIQVPINLRKMYSSNTMRNFSLFITPEIDLRLGDYTFEEILHTVHHLMQLEMDKKLINKIISRNVGAERNILLKNTPLFVKSLILYFSYKISGPSRYSGVITNMGKVRLYEDVNELIDYFMFIPPPANKTLKANCGVIGFENNLVLSFGNITTSKALEQEFINVLTKAGLHVKIVN